VPLWLFVLIFVAIGWAQFWGNNRREKNAPQVADIQAKAASSTSPQDDKGQTVGALQHQVSELQRQVGALAARVDSLERGSPKKRGPR
jgi:phage I-like protein